MKVFFISLFLCLPFLGLYATPVIFHHSKVSMTCFGIVCSLGDELIVARAAQYLDNGFYQVEINDTCDFYDWCRPKIEKDRRDICD